MLIWMLVHCGGAQKQNYKNGVLAQQVMDLTVIKLSLNWTKQHNTDISMQLVLLKQLQLKVATVMVTVGWLHRN